MTLQRRLQLIGHHQDEQWMKTALKVAFATKGMKYVDQHFGAAKTFALYAVDQEKFCLIEVTEFDDLSMDGNEDKLVAKISALEGCIAIYTQAIGASAMNQLKAKKIQPVKVSSDVKITALLKALQEELIQGPGSWLAKAIANTSPTDPSRFDDMEEEGWEE